MKTKACYLSLKTELMWIIENLERTSWEVHSDHTAIMYLIVLKLINFHLLKKKKKCILIGVSSIWKHNEEDYEDYVNLC